MKTWFSPGVFAMLLPLLLGPRAVAQTPGQSKVPPDFGNHDIETRSLPIAVPLKNPTGSKVKFTVALSTDSGQDYQIEKNGCTEEVAAGAECIVDIIFSPVVKGKRPGKLLVSFQTVPDGKFSSLPPVELTGFGFSPDLGISLSQILFPAQAVLTKSAPQRIVLTNNTPTDLKIEKIIATDGFHVEGPVSSQTLRTGDSAVAFVSFRPEHPGIISGFLTIFSGARESPQNVYLSGSTPDLLRDLYAVSSWIEIPLIFVLCFLYWLAMVVVRWNRVARPTREFLKAEIGALQAKLNTVSVGKDQNRKGNVSNLPTSAKTLIDPENEQRAKRVANFLFWSRGQEMTGWGYVHEAEVQMTPFLEEETVRARLETNEQQLRTVTDAPSLALADAIHTELTPPTNNPARRRSLLAEALNSNYQREDSKFSDLVSWQNKASWLVGCGLVTIFVLSIAIPHHSLLFLVGATGGLLSRLSRSLDRKDVPTDYGASWATLFLSPVAGALGAWAGILISGLAIRLQVLGSAFSANWDDP